MDFLILNFRRVLIVVAFLLAKSPASVYYGMPTFRNSLSVPSSKAVVEHCLRRWNRLFARLLTFYRSDDGLADGPKLVT